MAGNPRMESSKVFNNGTYCHIGQWDIDLNIVNGIDTDGRDLQSPSAFDKYTGSSTTLQLSQVAADAIANKFDDWNVHGYDVDDTLELGAYYDADWWIDYKQILNESVQWLWGDLEGGGLGIFTTGLDYNSGVYFIGTYGVYRNDEERPYEKICAFVNNIPYSISQLTDCCLCYVYDVAHDSLSGSYHCLYYVGGNGQQALEYTFKWLTIQGYKQYNYGYTNDTSALTQNMWKSYLGNEFPAICFARNSLSVVGGNSDVVPISREITDAGFHLDHGSIDNSDTYNPNDQGGITDPEDPDGGFDNWSDDIDYTDVEDFANDAVSSGFVTLYNPNQGNVQAFTDFLFTGITESVSNVLKRLISSPLDYVIGMNVVHFTPRVRSASERIKFCGIDSGVSAPALYQFKTLECGSVDIDEQFNTFLDYGGFSKCKLVLPYCGSYPLEMNEIMSSTMTIKYQIDQLTGACVAQVRITRKQRSHVHDDPALDSVMYEFTGNVFSSVPLSALDYRGTIQGLMQIASGVSQVATGSAAGLGQVASGVMNITPDVQHSGNMSTSYGYLGRQKPLLILERPMQALANEFCAREGFVSNIFINKLSNLTGYNEIDINSFKTEYLKCTDAERDEIINILNGGFII